MIGRRRLLGGGAALAALAAAPLRLSAATVVEVVMRSNRDGSKVWFDPLGVLVQPGDTVRWICAENIHTTTAYHPSYESHSLRIPEAARPWHSEFMNPGDRFQITLTLPGVYDYFCAPHELAGMVGRIVVGHAAGPGTMAFDWFKGRPEGAEWQDVPPEAQAAFPPIEAIMRRGTVRVPP